MSSGISPLANRLLNIFVCTGAAVVIIGALFKIQHYPGSDLFLPIGLGTEALIFLVYAILPPADAEHPAPVEQVKGNPALKTMEKMLENADITPANLTKLSSGFQKLGTTVDKLSDIGDVVKSTTDFNAKTKQATDSLGNISNVLTQTATSFASLNTAADGTKQYQTQVQAMTKNLTSINSMYELELKESGNHLKAINQFYGKLEAITNNLQTSAVDAVKTKEQVAALAVNLGKLNQVYGNMLTAMQGR